MYHNTSPRDLYQDYQVRVDRAVRNYRWAMQPVARSRRPAKPRLRAWWSTVRARLTQHLQPAEKRSAA